MEEEIYKFLLLFGVGSGVFAALVWYYLRELQKEAVRTSDRAFQTEARIAEMYELQRRAVDFFKAQATAKDVKEAVYVEAAKSRRGKKQENKNNLLEGLEE